MAKEYLLKDGASMPALGMGTWYLGENLRPSAEEEKALCAGIDAGLRLIDTAEMYGNGRAEELLGRVLKQRKRDDLFLVSKVLPSNANRRSMARACENTLRRMGTDHLDLYLYHWRGGTPLQETVDCLEKLVREGKILRWGVSNFDLEDMEELFECENGDHCVVNQDLFHLGSRGIEVVLQPWMKQHGVVAMAYCPLAQAGSLRRSMLRSPAVQSAAKALGITPMQVLLGFVLSRDNTIAIPRTGTSEHMFQNAAMADFVMPQEILDSLDRAFPIPSRRVALDIQ